MSVRDCYSTPCSSLTLLLMVLGPSALAWLLQYTVLIVDIAVDGSRSVRLGVVVTVHRAHR